MNIFFSPYCVCLHREPIAVSRTFRHSDIPYDFVDYKRREGSDKTEVSSYTIIDLVLFSRLPVVSSGALP